MKKRRVGMSRRILIGGAALAATAAIYMAAIGRGALKACYADGEAALPADLQSLVRIGNSYLYEHSKNGKLDPRDELFLQETATTNIVYGVQQRLLALDYQIRDEFARCETVICDGWVLAKSEAQLCAAIAVHMRRI